MIKPALKPIDKRALIDWESFASNIRQTTFIDLNETPAQQAIRLKSLEADPVKWFEYYFTEYCKVKLARFHRRVLKRLIANKRWFQILMWARELAKSTFTMMVVLYLALVPKELKNILLVSNSQDNAVRLLTPYRLQLENNQRIIHDYGLQEKVGSWTDSEFTTLSGFSMRALGAGQSPRGTRNGASRVDCIIIDDIDTDEECRNPRRIKEKFKWIQEALIPTVSVSGDYRVIVCNNKIAKVCTVSMLEKLAHDVSIVNIRDENGKSSWPEKNSEEDINDMLRMISYASAQKEYFNNPISEGTIFKEMTYGEMRPLNEYGFLVCYTDPSFKSSSKNDFKATLLIGKWRDEFHIIKAFVEQTTTAAMIDWHYQISGFVGDKVPVYYFMEANFIQDELLQAFYKEGIKRGKVIPISGDTRKKPEKIVRIEVLLEPLNRNGKLILNKAEINNPHMQRCEEQFISLEPGSSAHDDAPDAAEGGVYILNQKHSTHASSIKIVKRATNSKRV
ncbi:hypothetical protein QT327_21300 [Olivibacter sp. 47]|uniref:hypothetical protein n=1 Tax=Olivibacter sp. 47 TaxID=3056486 RepID=UPI0025A45E3B|nr:hypothetical protein [Olivibacter sp. 47]MDM8176853.1 hypothetical protein [Olivibacter sp. 47]